jgi:hypothetical protein
MRSSSGEFVVADAGSVVAQPPPVGVPPLQLPDAEALMLSGYVPVLQAWCDLLEAIACAAPHVAAIAPQRGPIDAPAASGTAADSKAAADCSAAVVALVNAADAFASAAYMYGMNFQRRAGPMLLDLLRTVQRGAPPADTLIAGLGPEWSFHNPNNAAALLRKAHDGAVQLQAQRVQDSASGKASIAGAAAAATRSQLTGTAQSLTAHMLPELDAHLLDFLTSGAPITAPSVAISATPVSSTGRTRGMSGAGVAAAAIGGRYSALVGSVGAILAYYVQLSLPLRCLNRFQDFCARITSSAVFGVGSGGAAPIVGAFAHALAAVRGMTAELEAVTQEAWGKRQVRHLTERLGGSSAIVRAATAELGGSVVGKRSVYRDAASGDTPGNPSQRVLLHRGVVLKKYPGGTHERIMFLFDDMLVYAERDSATAGGLRTRAALPLMAPVATGADIAAAGTGLFKRIFGGKAAPTGYEEAGATGAHGTAGGATTQQPRFAPFVVATYDLDAISEDEAAAAAASVASSASPAAIAAAASLRVTAAGPLAQRSTGFVVATRERCYTFHAPSAVDKAHWLNAIRFALRRAILTAQQNGLTGADTDAGDAAHAASPKAAIRAIADASLIQPEIERARGIPSHDSLTRGVALSAAFADWEASPSAAAAAAGPSGVMAAVPNASMGLATSFTGGVANTGGATGARHAPSACRYAFWTQDLDEMLRPSALREWEDAVARAHRGAEAEHDTTALSEEAFVPPLSRWGVQAAAH